MNSIVSSEVQTNDCKKTSQETSIEASLTVVQQCGQTTKTKRNRPGKRQRARGKWRGKRKKEQIEKSNKVRVGNCTGELQKICEARGPNGMRNVHQNTKYFRYRERTRKEYQWKRIEEREQEMFEYSMAKKRKPQQEYYELQKKVEEERYEVARMKRKRLEEELKLSNSVYVPYLASPVPAITCTRADPLPPVPATTRAVPLPPPPPNMNTFYRYSSHFCTK